MGLPFYSRSTRTGKKGNSDARLAHIAHILIRHAGDWKTYEDLVKMYGKRIRKATDEIDEHYFNGYKMIQKKVRSKLFLECHFGAHPDGPDILTPWCYVCRLDMHSKMGLVG